MKPTALALLLLCGLLRAERDPFEAPRGLSDFARRQTHAAMDSRAKIETLVRAFFAPVEQGGLGITYDNAFTRTVEEGFRDRKANCFTLTAMYIACCRTLGVEARYAESLRISQWRRSGNTIRNEHHLVALVPNGPFGNGRVADFLPEVTTAVHHLLPLSEARARALFYSNRAIELLESADPQTPLEAAAKSVKADPTHGGGWNVLGVVQRAQGMEAEAEASFRKAIRLNPKEGIPYGNLEGLLRSQEREEEAQACREQALELRKKDPYFNAFLAQEALEAGQWEEAGQRVGRALDILPHEPEFFLLQARLSLAQGRDRAAVKALEQARKWTLPEDQPRWDAKLARVRAAAMETEVAE